IADLVVKKDKNDKDLTLFDNLTETTSEIFYLGFFLYGIFYPTPNLFKKIDIIQNFVGNTVSVDQEILIINYSNKLNTALEEKDLSLYSESKSQKDADSVETNDKSTI